MSKSSFQLYILNEDWHKLRLGYELQESWPVLKKVDLQNSLMVIGAEDIEVYNWSQQSITLTLEASARLREKLSEEKMEIPLTSRKNGFVATFDGEWLYGGIFLEPGSAMAISYPVIYPEISEGQVVFLLRPIHSVLIRYQDLEPSFKNIIEAQKVHDFFYNLGNLVE